MATTVIAPESAVVGELRVKVAVVWPAIGLPSWYQTHEVMVPELTVAVKVTALPVLPSTFGKVPIVPVDEVIVTITADGSKTLIVTVLEVIAPTSLVTVHAAVYAPAVNPAVFKVGVATFVADNVPPVAPQA